mmetsp:Transcript_7115/g.20975  ORF Transcript_7115/g.20975 Transcript_7115/m.20975 type:complete len:521 (+) Transcript_7115:730-2292(+)
MVLAQNGFSDAQCLAMPPFCNLVVALVVLDDADVRVRFSRHGVVLPHASLANVQGASVLVHREIVLSLQTQRGPYHGMGGSHIGVLRAEHCRLDFERLAVLCDGCLEISLVSVRMSDVLKRVDDEEVIVAKQILADLQCPSLLLERSAKVTLLAQHVADLSMRFGDLQVIFAQHSLLNRQRLLKVQQRLIRLIHHTKNEPDVQIGARHIFMFASQRIFLQHQQSSVELQRTIEFIQLFTANAGKQVQLVAVFRSHHLRQQRPLHRPVLVQQLQILESLGFVVVGKCGTEEFQMLRQSKLFVQRFHVLVMDLDFAYVRQFILVRYGHMVQEIAIPIEGGFCKSILRTNDVNLPSQPLVDIGQLLVRFAYHAASHDVVQPCFAGTRPTFRVLLAGLFVGTIARFQIGQHAGCGIQSFDFACQLIQHLLQGRMRLLPCLIEIVQCPNDTILQIVLLVLLLVAPLLAFQDPARMQLEFEIPYFGRWIHDFCPFLHLAPDFKEMRQSIEELFHLGIGFRCSLLLF